MILYSEHGAWGYSPYPISFKLYIKIGSVPCYLQLTMHINHYTHQFVNLIISMLLSYNLEVSSNQDLFFTNFAIKSNFNETCLFYTYLNLTQWVSQLVLINVNIKDMVYFLHNYKQGLEVIRSVCIYIYICTVLEVYLYIYFIYK